MRILVLILFISFSSSLQAQNKELCGLSVKDEIIRVVDNLVTFNLTWINRSKKNIDDIRYSIDYFNTYGDLVTTKSYTWETGLFTDPIKSGYQVTYMKLEYITSGETIKKFNVHINRIHYTDDTSCSR